MNDTALYALLLAVIGLPVTVGGVALVARHLVNQHAEQYGPAIRAAGRDMDTRAFAAVQRELARADRPKETIR